MVKSAKAPAFYWRPTRFQRLPALALMRTVSGVLQTWLPELDPLPAEYAHRPWQMNADAESTYDVVLGVDYPEPMIDVTERFSELRGQ